MDREEKNEGEFEGARPRASGRGGADRGWVLARQALTEPQTAVDAEPDSTRRTQTTSAWPACRPLSRPRCAARRTLAYGAGGPVRTRAGSQLLPASARCARERIARRIAITSPVARRHSRRLHDRRRPRQAAARPPRHGPTTGSQGPHSLCSVASTHGAHTSHPSHQHSIRAPPDSSCHSHGADRA